MPKWYREGTRALAEVLCEGREAGFQRAVAEEAAEAVPGAMWWDLHRGWKTNTCDDLEVIARALERVGPAVGRCAADGTEELARLIRLPDSVAVPIGAVVGALMQEPFDNQMRVTAIVIRAFGIGVCADHGRSEHLEPQRLEPDHCACFTADTREIDASVRRALLVIMSVSLGLGPSEETAPDRTIDQERARTIVSEAVEKARTHQQEQNRQIVDFSQALEQARQSLRGIERRRQQRRGQALRRHFAHRQGPSLGEGMGAGW